MAVIGIDLGTTNSLAACWTEQGAELIADENHRVLFPSVVGYVEGEGFLVGEAAKERLLTHSADTVGSFKRFMGTTKQYTLGGKSYTAMELSAMVLERIRRNAEHVLKEPVEEAIITVPAYFNDKQRSDTKKAAQIAGLHVERLINESSAAALAYRMEYGEEDKSLLIFDFGGGTLDLSYVECFDNVIEIIAVTGDNYLGGDDIDRLIAEYFCRENGLDAETLSPEEYAGVRKSAEEAKCALEHQPEVSMELELGGKICKTRFDEDILFEICMPLFTKMKQLFLHILEDADARISDLDDLIMVGGSSRLAVVKRFLTELLGKEPVVLGDTDKVVAMGAGAYAGIRQRREEIRDMLLTDVCPFTLGLGVRNRNNEKKNLMNPMIERNSTLPSSRTEHFVTAYDYQEEISIKIYQGEEYYVDENVYLGEISIRVEPKPRGVAGIDVCFTYDINGILHVSVENEQGERKQILLANQSLSEEELAMYTREMEQVMLPPIQKPENQELINRLLAYYEESTGERRERIGFFIQWFIAGLNSQRKYVVKKAVDTAKEQLEYIEKTKECQEDIRFNGSLKWQNEETDMGGDMDIEEEEAYMENEETAEEYEE